jgi:hypothetical protein
LARGRLDIASIASPPQGGKIWAAAIPKQTCFKTAAAGRLKPHHPAIAKRHFQKRKQR